MYKKINILMIFGVMFLASCSSKTIVVDDNEILTDCRPEWAAGKVPRNHYVGVAKSNSETAARSKSAFNARADMAKAKAIGTDAGNVYRDAMLLNAGYVYDEDSGRLVKKKFGGLRRLQNYKK